VGRSPCSRMRQWPRAANTVGSKVVGTGKAAAATV
jgi:hypothetical protein